ncbi:MAG: GTPase [Leptolyngbyaceae cyanobacterium SL_1_1]|nr:GTPase [Leptolyngbyaceae cyanobacterium RM1_1_2]NJO11695.1 GTPase [Leptolyngbyaceae cyanobacterium SL_1_1]
MIQLKRWQWAVLTLPVVSIAAFLLISAGWQIHDWGLNWIWAVLTLVLVGWRWLLVRWTRPVTKELEAVVAEVSADVSTALDPAAATPDDLRQAEAALEKILAAARSDRPIWQDWPAFWQRCQDTVAAIAHIYHPEVKYPLLNIYIPQAYGLIRGTVDDTDRWMQKLSPVLNQVSVGQAYQAYEVYQKLEPSARKLWQVWNWAQWVINPAVAATNMATQRTSDRASQQLLVNLSQLLREAALKNLAQQSIALYSGNLSPALTPTPISAPLPAAPRVQTLRDILDRAEPVEQVTQKDVSVLLVGRTGAGKSSLINSLFQVDRAAVDVLPSTDEIQSYHWQAATGETLILWDTPGYEQVQQAELRQLVLEYATSTDLLLLVTPALDPALQMDVDFLRDLQTEGADLPAIAVITQVDRLRPIREWQPPYDWQQGDRPKEQSIRAATEYRSEQFGDHCVQAVPVVTQDSASGRSPWNLPTLSLELIRHLEPAKQQRLARFLRNQAARAIAATKIIDHYTFQMATTQGLATLLKSPVLQFISTLTTGSPTLAYLLAEKIPVEDLPIVIGKLQMAYELFSLLSDDGGALRKFDLLALWPLLLENPSTPDRNAWAFGHTLIEYWTQNLTVAEFKTRFAAYLQEFEPTAGS